MSIDRQTYLLRFETTSLAEANYYAEELRIALLDASPDITVQRKRDDQMTQDVGSTLILILGTPAIVAAVNAIGNWLQQRTSASLTLETPEKKLIIQNISSKDITKLTEILLPEGQHEDK